MSDNIVNMARVIDDNRLCTPEQILADALELLRSGKRNYNKVLILTLLTEPIGVYDVGFLASNMRVNEMLALSTYSSHLFNKIISGEEP